jgi:ubiquinol-cytochrome c reductase iron-sulfur subunit/rieske iron-sulfur protein
MVVAGLTATASAGMSAGVLAQDDPGSMPPQVGDYLVLTSDQPTPLTADILALGGRPTRAWAADPATMTPRDGSFLNLIMVSRWSPDELAPEAAEYAAEGVVAVTAVCTHQACDVSDWVEDVKLMECPCHFSRFDPRAIGAVVEGPATRRLPALKLAVEDDRIVIAAAFDSRVGGDVSE